MRTLIPTLVFLMLASYCHGQVERDKALHFLGGNLFGLAGAGIAKQMSDGNRVWTFIGSVAGSAIIGVAKEAVDSGQQDNGWDNDDLAATVLGGVTVGVTIELFSKKDKEKRLRGQYSHVDFKEQKFESLPINTEFVVYDGKLPSLNSFGIPQAILQTK
ncbi:MULTISPECIES: hypothetical protein [Flavobacteriaceae]|uniref:hypothetical protein n=1 Tax=Flavobacteriaceae TaxID=49546 RepID=UPI001C0EA129|nr:MULTISPECIES: hypothetical protein [Allomuricauda]MDC6367064.1 hypothetical protein [Muricauda sp. AC10]